MATSDVPAVLAQVRALAGRMRALAGAVDGAAGRLGDVLRAPPALDAADLAALRALPPAMDAKDALAQRRDALQRELAHLRAQFGHELRRAAAPEVLNEEGLPFVELSEEMPASPPATPRLEARRMGGTNVLGRTPGRIEPFVPQAPAGDRRAWMESIFSELEAEEEAEREAREKQEAQEAPGAGAPGGRPASASTPLRRGFLNPTRRAQVAARGGADPEDDGVAEEAARIVELLGPEVIRGHPNADRILADIAAQPRVEYRDAPPRPAREAVGEAVVERTEPQRAPAPAPAAKPRKVSAFKRRAQGDVPLGPTVSHGVSALERAARADEERAAPRAMPHARPSKAYAAKLAARETVDSDGEEEIRPGKRVHFGGVTAEGDEMEEDEDEEDEDEEDEDEDDASLWDSDDEYTAEDIEGLRPAMAHGADVPDELAQAYADARARLFAQPPAEHDVEDYGLASLNLPQGSRFKAERRAAANDAAAQALADGERPMLVLPSLAPVRFPRPAADGINLDGESDEDDEQLHALMRARLAMGDAGDDDGSARPARDERPPVVRATR